MVTRTRHTLTDYENLKFDDIGRVRVSLGTADIEINATVSDVISVAPLRDSVVGTAVNVSVGTTAIPSTALTGRKSMSIKNVTSTTAYIGGINVSSTNGFTLEQSESYDLDVTATVAIYGVSQIGTATLRIMEFN